MRKTTPRSEWEDIPGFDRTERKYIRLDGDAWLAAHRIREEGARWQLVPVVHGKDPRAGRRALRAAGVGPRVGGACGPTGGKRGLCGRSPAS